MLSPEDWTRGQLLMRPITRVSAHAQCVLELLHASFSFITCYCSALCTSAMLYASLF